MTMPMTDMRAPALGELARPLATGVKRVFQQERGAMFLLPGAATAAWEAAITNTLAPGDTVLVARHGRFSLRWAETARALGLEVEVVDAPWGAPLPVQELTRRLEADRAGRIKAVFVAHNETSTGVTSPVPAVRDLLDALDHSALLLVDGVSSIAAIDFRMDAWGVDVAVAASPHGFMLEPGLAMVGVSEKALAAGARAGTRRANVDFGAMAAAGEAGVLPANPPGDLLQGLRASLDRLFAEGLHRVFARHRRLAEGVRRAVRAWGLEPVARDPRFQSPTVTAVRLPSDVDAREVVRIAREAHGTALGAGLGPLTGKAFRIAHVGAVDEATCLHTLAGTERALGAAGVPVQVGAGVGAAESFFRDAGRGFELRAVA